MNIAQSNVGKRKVRKVMLMANDDLNRAIANNVEYFISASSLEVVPEVATDEVIPWDGVDATKASYPDFEKLNETFEDGVEYVLVLDVKEGNSPYFEVMPYYTKDPVDDKPRRDTTESKKACEHMVAALKSLRCTPKSQHGAIEIDYNEVKTFNEIVNGNQVFINLDMNCPAGYEGLISEAIARGIKKYFNR